MTPKEQLKQLLNELIRDKGLLCLSGAIFVDHEQTRNGQTRTIKANVTVDNFVDSVSEEYAAAMHSTLVAVHSGECVSHDEAKQVLNKWLDAGDPTERPTNRDLVEHSKMDKDLLMHLVTFVLMRERFPER